MPKKKYEEPLWNSDLIIDTVVILIILLVFALTIKAVLGQEPTPLPGTPTVTPIPDFEPPETCPTPTVPPVDWLPTPGPRVTLPPVHYPAPEPTPTLRPYPGMIEPAAIPEVFYIYAPIAMR